jgi:peptide/nickel transport system permease protein
MTASHPLGTDHLGRDLLSRIMAGGWRTARVILAVGSIGFTLGTVAAALGGWRETVILAARSLGVSSAGMVGRHLLPNNLPSMFAYVGNQAGLAVVAYASLASLGFLGSARILPSPTGAPCCLSIASSSLTTLT